MSLLFKVAVGIIAVSTTATLATCVSPSALPARAQEKSFDFAGATARLQKAAEEVGVAWPLRSPEIFIFKERRLLELRADGRMVRSYPIALGNEPELDKEREGDHRTPEGTFYVCTRNQQSRFHLFLGISYPMPEDAERGLRERLISKTEYQQILRAVSRKDRPSWETGLGGQVGIHGGGTRSDWTWGCIALENSAIEELWIASPLRTPVTIAKQ